MYTDQSKRIMKKLLYPSRKKKKKPFKELSTFELAGNLNEWTK